MVDLLDWAVRYGIATDVVFTVLLCRDRLKEEKEGELSCSNYWSLNDGYKQSLLYEKNTFNCNHVHRYGNWFWVSNCIQSMQTVQWLQNKL